MIIDQKLFAPIIHFVLSAEEKTQLALFYGFNGLLSAISDNVFVATVYINEAKNALAAGAIAPHQFELLAVAINTVQTYLLLQHQMVKRHSCSY